jgi:Ca-activated chloride channel family protein
MDRLARDNLYQIPSPQTGYPLYPWLLGLSILLFVWGGTRRADIVVVVLLTPLFFSQNVQAAPWEEQKAYDAFINKDYRKASIAYEQIQTFNGQMGMGAAAYRLGDWQQALEAYTRARQLATNDNERAKAAYNKGNTLARLGNYDKASEAYQEALVLQKNFPHAALNLTLINKERRQAVMKNTDRPKITPDAEDALSDNNAAHTDTSIANDNREETSAADNVSNTLVNQADHEKLIEQTIAKWNLGNAGTSDDMGSALWQQRRLDDTPDALLRARFTDQDAQHPALAEEKPW